MLIYGAGGHAKVLVDLLKESGSRIEAIFDDDPSKEVFRGISVANVYSSNLHSGQPLIIAIGDNFIRKKLAAMITHRFENAFHFSCLTADNVQIGLGNVVLHQAVIQSDTIIGNHCIVNTGAQIDHDCHIADYVHIGPGSVLCGNVTIGDCTLVGAGSVIVPNVVVGKNCLISAGSIVTKNVPDCAVVRGNPARIIKTNTL
jgi:sugar O-acyltransferase (sialic acid O-acetyltransferase NeuD family)